MTSQQPTTCPNCGKTASKHCGRCFGGCNRDGTIYPSTYYCGETCQREHAPQHRSFCKAAADRRQLIRAGDLVQAHFYAYRRAVFDVTIKTARQGSHGKLHVYEAPSVAPDTLIPFPDHHFLTENDKKSMLVWCSCDDGPRQIRSLIRQSFNGLHDKAEDVVLKPRPDIRRIVYHHGNGELDIFARTDFHTIHRVEIAGVQYAFDLSSAQYGHHQTVTPWTEYAAKIVSSVTMHAPYGGIVDQFVAETERDMQLALHGIGLKAATMHKGPLLLTQKVYAEKVDELVASWVEDQPAPLTDLLAFGEARFGRMIEAPAKKVAKALQTFGEEIESSGKILAYVSKRSGGLL